MISNNIKSFVFIGLLLLCSNTAILAINNSLLNKQHFFISSNPKKNDNLYWPKEVDKVFSLVKTPTKNTRTFRFTKNFGISINLMLPELYPLNIFWFANNYLAFKIFYAPAHKLNVKVELERDTISTTNGWIIEHPDLNIDFILLYGDHYGTEIYWFPFYSNFYIAGGISSRQISIKGNVKSPLLLRPIGTSEDNMLTTRTIFELGAKTHTQAVLARISVGWLKILKNKYFLNLNLAGFAMPIKNKQHINSYGNIDSPIDDYETIEQLNILKTQKLKELDEKILKEISKLNKKTILIIGMGIGIFF